MQIFYIIISSIISFLAGLILASIRLNYGADTDARKDAVSMIDEVVELFHSRFTNDVENQRIAATLFDFRIRSLVDNTTLLPIIGKAAFDGEYTRYVGELFKLSINHPRELDDRQIDALLERVNQVGVALKKIASLNRGNLRLFRRH